MGISFRHDGQDYIAERLSAMQQLHVSRRIAPLIPPLIPVFMALAEKGELMDRISDCAALAQPFADALASMPDDSAEFVISTCMSVVKRKNGEIYAPVWNSTAKLPMFSELNDMSVLLPIVVRVIQDNLGRFIEGLLTSKQASTATPE